MLSYSRVDNHISKVEQFLNPIEWIPKISIAGGVIRILLGTMETVAGFALMVFKIMQGIVDGKVSTFQESQRGVVYSLHGCANIARGVVAVTPLNLLLLVYDAYIGRLNYQFEVMQEGVYPIVSAYQMAQSNY